MSANARFVQIRSFDCEKLTGAPDERLDGAIARGTGISGWNNGGPAGAVWNAVDLRCAADINVGCSEGDLITEMRVGRALVARSTQPIGGRSALRWSQVIPESKWEPALDEGSATERYYRIGIFRLTAAVACTKPERLDPGLASHRAVVADRAFTAGFATGE